MKSPYHPNPEKLHKFDVEAKLSLQDELMVEFFYQFLIRFMLEGLKIT